VFVFPKKFEFQKFVFHSSFLRIQRIKLLHVGKSYRIFVGLYTSTRDEGGVWVKWCLMYTINDSDIGFLMKLKEFVGAMQSTLNPDIKLLYVLIGSCGSTLPEDLGKTFYINAAIKYDRMVSQPLPNGDDSGGPSNAVLLKFREEKFLAFAASQVCTEGLTCFSGNMLVESVMDVPWPNKLHEYGEKPRLFEMDTFEFYYVMHSLGIEAYCALRFVSDVIGDTSNQKLSRVRIVLKTVPIHNLLRPFFQEEGGCEVVKSEIDEVLAGCDKLKVLGAVNINFRRMVDMNGMGTYVSYNLGEVWSVYAECYKEFFEKYQSLDQVEEYRKEIHEIFSHAVAPTAGESKEDHCSRAAAVLTDEESVDWQDL